WSLIVAASNDRPDILDSILTNRVMARTMTAPFLSWVEADNVRADVEKTIKDVVTSRRTLSDEARYRDLVTGRNRPRDLTPPIAPAATPEPPEDPRRRLSLDLEIPRGAVDRMFSGK